MVHCHGCCPIARQPTCNSHCCHKRDDRPRKQVKKSFLPIEFAGSTSLNLEGTFELSKSPSGEYELEGDAEIVFQGAANGACDNGKESKARLRDLPKKHKTVAPMQQPNKCSFGKLQSFDSDSHRDPRNMYYNNLDGRGFGRYGGYDGKPPFDAADRLKRNNAGYYLPDARDDYYYSPSRHAGAGRGYHYPYYMGRDADLYGGRDADLYGGRGADLYGGRDADLYGGRGEDLYGGRVADLYGGRDADLYGGRGADLYSGRAADLYGGRGADLYGSRAANLYGGRGADLYGGRAADLYGGRGADLYGGRGMERKRYSTTEEPFATEQMLADQEYLNRYYRKPMYDEGLMGSPENEYTLGGGAGMIDGGMAAYNKPYRNHRGVARLEEAPYEYTVSAHFPKGETPYM